MRVVQSFDQLVMQDRTVVLGNFDGVHMGHQKLIGLGKEIAVSKNESLMVFTFWPQPQAVFSENFKVITPLAVKSTMLEGLGVDELFAIPFDESIGHLSPQEFVEDILVGNLQAKNIVIGFNYSFGYKGKGNTEAMIRLAEPYGVKVHVLDPFYLEQQLVNSSLIRKCIGEGNIEEATYLLGYAPLLYGEVVHGRKLGRTIGVPTANLAVGDYTLLPPNGVYGTTVLLEDEIKLGVLNIGSRPTVNNGDDRSVEVHILDFEGDLYGEYIAVHLHTNIRPEAKFNGLDELKAQINKDMDTTRLQLQSKIG